jgi:acyl carrier protein phosphodiesterase
MSATDRKWKPVRSQKVSQSEEAEKIWAGIDRHVRADALFHNSEFFRKNTIAIREIFENYKLGNADTRLFFVAHIALEMMLDRILLQEQPKVADDFYRDLAIISNTIIQKEIKEATGIFFQMFDRFRESRYLYNYIRNDSMQIALNRVLGRASQQIFPENRSQDLHAAFMETEKLIQQQFNKFIENMKY